MRIFDLIFILVLAISGCASEHYSAGHGDVGQFILRQATRYGGVPTTTNNLPVITSHWRYSEDERGMQIHLPTDDYSRIEAFLDRAFAGKHQFGSGGSAENNTRIHEYRLSPKGGGIQLTGQDDDTQVIIIRPLDSSL